MDCKGALKKMSAFIDNELKDNELIEMSRHINGCISCRRQNETLCRTWKLLEAVEEIEAPADFEQKFWRKAKTQKQENLFIQTLVAELTAGWMPRFAVLVVFIFGVMSGFLLSEKIIYFKQKSAKTTISRIDVLHLSNLKNPVTGPLYKTYYSLFENI